MATKTTKTRKSVFPKSIQNMIQRAYDRGDHAADAAERINKTAIAAKLGVSLKSTQVASAYAWITMRRG